MKLTVLALRDLKSDTFGNPIFSPSVGGTMRDIADYVNDPDPKEVAQKHPGDFQLMRLGEFDNTSGLFILEPLPVLICGLASLAAGQVGSGATAAN